MRTMSRVHDVFERLHSMSVFPLHMVFEISDANLVFICGSNIVLRALFDLNTGSLRPFTKTSATGSPTKPHLSMPFLWVNITTRSASSFDFETVKRPQRLNCLYAASSTA